MKKILFSVLLSSVFALLSCSEKELPVDVRGAEQQGRADAKALCSAGYKADRDLHAALLAVKSREFEMRRGGDSIGAAAYIAAFKEQLKVSDNQLAQKVL